MNAESTTVDSLTDRKLAEQHAWGTFERQEWVLSNELWTRIRERFPDSFTGFAVGAAVLQRLRQFDEAERLYVQAFERWPSAAEFGFLVDYAELAQARGDVVEASRRWGILRQHFPQHPKSYVRDGENLSSSGRQREAELLLEQGLKYCPDDPEMLIQLAHTVQRRGDLQDTLNRWEAVAKACPSLLDGYLGAAGTLYDLGRFADAHDILQPALRMFPDAMYVADLQARIAFRQDRFADALKYWANFREQFPTNPAGFCGGVDALLAQSNYQEADTLIQEGRGRFPRDPHVAMSWCIVSESWQKTEDAQFRWEVAYSRFPTFAPIRAGFGRILSRNKKWSEAEEILRLAIADNVDDTDLMSAYAHCAAERADWSEAAQRWNQVRERFVQSPAGWIGLGDTLRLSGRLDDSAQLLREALEMFPGDADLEQSLAWTHNFRRDWPSALPLWAALKRKYPNKPNVISGITAALWEARQELGIAQSEGKPAPFEIPESLLSDNDAQADEKTAIRKMLLKFESIGDSCEFGIVQRRFGAEPLGLLRWATTDPPQLIEALNTRLEGVGDPEHTVIEEHDGEYISWDRRYAMYTHTFTPVTAEPLDTFTGQHLRRLQYMKRKLLEDLESGKKIFVYKSDDGLPDEHVRGLHDAIRGYNNTALLLCVRLQNDAHPMRTLEVLQEGLFIGYIDRYSTVDINVDVWLDLCRQLLARLQE